MSFFSSPRSVTVQSEGKWKKNTDEVTLSNNVISLRTSCASWVKIEWAAEHQPTALVLGDAWERSYAELEWEPILKDTYHPWYFSVLEENTVTCYGVKTGPSAFCSWRVSPSAITLLMDVRCGCLDTQFDGRELILAELITLQKSGDPFDIIHEFCTMMCPNPKLPTAPFYGGDDWYDNYGDNSFDKIISHVKKLAECSVGLKNRPFQTVDAGWQPCHNWYPGEEFIGGPFTGCNVKFKNMRLLAEEIRQYDVRPGIWLRPLETAEYVPEEAILRRDRNVKYLDPTHPFTIEKADADLRRLREWGYELIKHDFAAVDIFGHYGPDMTESVAAPGNWAFYDRSKTSAEINREYYQRTSESVGDALINACNTFSHLSAGIFPIFRIGDDTSGYDHKRTVEMGVNTLAFRGVQHNAFYAVDPDCIAFTSKLERDQIMQWWELVKAAGTSLIVSIEDTCYDDFVKAAVTEAFRNASEQHEIAKPIDWTETALPTRWKTFEGDKVINWKY